MNSNLYMWFFFNGWSKRLIKVIHYAVDRYNHGLKYKESVSANHLYGVRISNINIIGNIKKQY